MLTGMTEDNWALVVEIFRAVRSRRGDKGRNDRRFLEARAASSPSPRDENEIFPNPDGVSLPSSHPGETLGEELAAWGLSANALALKLRVPANRITDIIRGRRGLTAETAPPLGRYLGTGARFWVDLQASHDLAIVERDFGDAIVREVDPA